MPAIMVSTRCLSPVAPLRTIIGREVVSNVIDPGATAIASTATIESAAEAKRMQEWTRIGLATSLAPAAMRGGWSCCKPGAGDLIGFCLHDMRASDAVQTSRLEAEFIVL